MLENCKKVPITFQMHIYLLNTLQIKESLLLEKKEYCLFADSRKKKSYLLTTPTIKTNSILYHYFFFPNLITIPVT